MFLFVFENNKTIFKELPKFFFPIHLIQWRKIECRYCNYETNTYLNPELHKYQDISLHWTLFFCPTTEQI